MRARRCLGLAAVLFLALATAAWERSASAQAPAGRPRLVLISLDGFGADNLADSRLPLPNIRGLAARGATAERMTVVTPSVTWPNHTTLVTGVTPGTHGVLANGLIEPAPEGGPPFLINPRRSRDELCRVPTLYDVARQAGLTTAEVNWPVTRGASALDWSFPDHPEPLRYTTPALRKELVGLKLLADETDAALSRLGGVGRDHVWTQAAVHLIRRHKPHLLLLHLLNTDSTQHAHGPGSAEALTALSLADRYVGDILAALREEKLLESTVVFVTADHGFVRVTRQVRPNVRLKARGMIRTSPADASRSEWDAQSISEGGVALVYVPQKLFHPEIVDRTRAALEGLEGVEKILEPGDFNGMGLGLHPRDRQMPSFVLAARDGYSFSNDTTGEEVVSLARPIGAHGYVHTNPRLDAILVTAGPGVRPGAVLPRARSIDVAPTAARLLGLEMRDTQGRVLSEFLQ